MFKCNRRISRTSMQKKVSTELSHPQPMLFFEKYSIFVRPQTASCILRISRTHVHILALSRGFIAATAQPVLPQKGQRSAHLAFSDSGEFFPPFYVGGSAHDGSGGGHEIISVRIRPTNWNGAIALRLGALDVNGKRDRCRVLS